MGTASSPLDQPAAVLLKSKQRYVSSFDKPEQEFVNPKLDAPHTMPVIGRL
ncbi:MAG TPA: hypothetical protein VF690_12070 [Hymenobacter sp.]